MPTPKPLLMDQLAEHLFSTWYPCTPMQRMESSPPISITHAKGVWLYDNQGNRYLDAISSWWVNLFGHNHPQINAAITAQLEKLSHIMLAGLTHEPVEQLSAQLIQLAPQGLKHCFYASDGASAVEIALKMSHHYWRNIGKPNKSAFVSLSNGYHGETLGALGVTDVALFKQAYAPLLQACAQVPSPDWRNAEQGEDATSFAVRCAQALEEYLSQYSQNIAAFILEPLVQGAAGMGMYHTDYLRRARQICDRYQVHLIADEIAVGFGRTGTLFACEQAGITPDLMCLSKGLSGGYLPLSTVLTTQDIFEAFYAESSERAFLHSHSYSGNALGCAAAVSVLDIFAKEDAITKNRKKSAFITELAQPIAHHPRVKNFRQLGMIWAFDINDTQKDFAQRFHRQALKNQLLLRPLGNTVYWMPPYIINEQESVLLANNTLKTLEQV